MKDILNNSGYLTLLGIVLGWILSALSSALRGRSDRRSDLSKAIARLLPELIGLESLTNALESFKNTTNNWAEYERTRVRLWKRHGNVLSDSMEMSQILDAVAKHKPFLAIRVRGLMVIAQKLRDNDLTATSKTSDDAYVKLLSALEVGRDGLASELLSCVRSLSWAASISSGISFELFNWNRGGGKARRKSNALFVQDLHKDVWQDLSKNTSTVDEPKT